MTSVAGEVADGVRPHPVCTPSYIRDVMLPAVRTGAAELAMLPVENTTYGRVADIHRLLPEYISPGLTRLLLSVWDRDATELLRLIEHADLAAVTADPAEFTRVELRVGIQSVVPGAAREVVRR